jgi:hypothetical protein
MRFEGYFGQAAEVGNCPLTLQLVLGLPRLSSRSASGQPKLFNATCWIRMYKEDIRRETPDRDLS